MDVHLHLSDTQTPISLVLSQLRWTMYSSETNSKKRDAGFLVARTSTLATLLTLSWGSKYLALQKLLNNLGQRSEKRTFNSGAWMSRSPKDNSASITTHSTEPKRDSNDVMGKLWCWALTLSLPFVEHENSSLPSYKKCSGENIHYISHLSLWFRKKNYIFFLDSLVRTTWLPGWPTSMS